MGYEVLSIAQNSQQLFRVGAQVLLLQILEEEDVCFGI